MQMESSTSRKPIHLVGSYPAPDASTAFKECCSALKDKVDAVPDGEPGWRWNFTIGLIAKLATAHPSLAPIWREYDETYLPKPVTPLPADQVESLTAIINSTDWSMGYDTDARSSYDTYIATVKSNNPSSTTPPPRFQICLPGASSVAIFVKPQFQYLIESLIHAQLLAETQSILNNIPVQDIAIQIDIASDFIKCEAEARPEVLDTLREDFHPLGGESMLERYAVQHAALLDLLPDEVDAGLHICMGNIGNEPVLAARDMGVMVQLVNAINAKLTKRDVREKGRGLQWGHFGALRPWTEARFYEPLKKLELGEQLMVYVGIVYPHDVEAAKQRLVAAKAAVADVGVSPPCGLARTSKEGVQSVFGILNDLTT